MKISKSILMGAVLMPALLLAEPPATRPARPREHGERPLASYLESRENDWNQAFEFYTRYSPKRAAAFSKLPDGDEKNRVKRMMLAQYAGWKFLGKDNSELSKLKLEQIQIQDDLFGLKTQLTENPSQADAIKPQIREKVTALVDHRLKERELRIDELKKLLAKEEGQLERDEKRKDEIIDNQYNEVIRAKRPDRVLRRPGGGGGGGK